MKIYLVERTDEVSWNEYKAFVCVAESEDEALSIIPGGYIDDWTDKSNLSATDLGIAHADQKKGIILSQNTGA